MVIRRILDADGDPAMTVFCFAYVYRGEGQSDQVRGQVQAHALRPRESNGYLSRVLIPNDEQTDAIYLLVALAFNDQTRNLFESADWDLGVDVSDELPDEIWNDAFEAHIRINLTDGANRLNERHYPDASGRGVEYGEESPG